MRSGDTKYPNRRAAGKVLAEHLVHFRGRPDALVLALPRGGVPVAFEVASELNLPLDVFLVRKLGVPGHQELAMGAIASGGIRVLNREVVAYLNIPSHVIDEVMEDELAELRRREIAYRGHATLLDLRNHFVILIDDGLATGSSMRAAVAAARQQGAAGIVVAVPVAAPDTCAEFQNEVDEIVCPLTPDPFHAVGLWYADFDQTSDAEVRELLQSARQRQVGSHVPQQ